ncbi:MAG: hypothetical protein KJZ87_00670 [Thermoguttaceae bacterium]|nr:hypothetical protein [Thermoguttaceae bacterium]
MWIDATHRAIAGCPLADGVLVQLRDRGGRIIPGWLRREDALKLYELAFFAPADILELGSFHGLSTSILAQAAAHSPFPKRACSIDLNLDTVCRERSPPDAKRAVSRFVARHSTGRCGLVDDLGGVVRHRLEFQARGDSRAQ